MKKIEKPWIEIGYKFFAYKGPNGIRIEQIAKEVGKNKSSFYHLFADLDIFTKCLLEFHLHQAKKIVEKESNAKSEYELIEILIDHKVDLLFNRHLRIHRENPEFERCFSKINQMTIPAILPLWSRIIGLPNNSNLAQMVLNLSIENFYLQITDATINEKWLIAYFKNIRDMISRLTYQKPSSALDGGV